MEDIFEKEYKKGNPNILSNGDGPIRYFKNPDEYHPQAPIESRFKSLMERLTVYEPSSDIYRLRNSKIVVQVFSEQMATIDTAKTKLPEDCLREEDLWPVLIRPRCR